MGTRQIEFQIAADPPPRLDKALSRDVPAEENLSRTRLTRLIDAGAILIDGAAARDPKAKVAEGAFVVITVAEAEDSHIGPENIPLEVVYEDADLIVVNKPAGMVVHPAPGLRTGRWSMLCCIIAAMICRVWAGSSARHCAPYRQETSGLLVVAKSDAAHHGLAAQFEAHSVERYYRAICYGVPDANDPRLPRRERC